PPQPTYTLFPYTTLFRSAYDLRPVQGSEGVAVGDREGVYGAHVAALLVGREQHVRRPARLQDLGEVDEAVAVGQRLVDVLLHLRSEEHTSELQSQSNLVC